MRAAFGHAPAHLKRTQGLRVRAKKFARPEGLAIPGAAALAAHPLAAGCLPWTPGAALGGAPVRRGRRPLRTAGGRGDCTCTREKQVLRKLKM